MCKYRCLVLFASVLFYTDQQFVQGRDLSTDGVMSRENDTEGKGSHNGDLW